MEIDVNFASKIATLLCCLMIYIFTIWDTVYCSVNRIQVVGTIMTNINLLVVNTFLLFGETKRQIVMEKFYLICNQFGRGIYCLFIALWLYGMSPKTPRHKPIHDFGVATAISVSLVGVMHIIQHFIFDKRQLIVKT